MAVTRRYFLEVSSLEPYDEEKLAGAISELISCSHVKLYRSSILEIKKKC